MSDQAAEAAQTNEALPQGSATDGVDQPIPEKLTPEAFLGLVRRHVRYSLGRDWGTLSSKDTLQAVSLAARDIMVDRMLATEHRYQAEDAKRVYYLSMEFLVGRSLGNNLVNIGVFEIAGKVPRPYGVGHRGSA